MLGLLLALGPFFCALDSDAEDLQIADDVALDVDVVAFLQEHDWHDWTLDESSIWVDVATQSVSLVKGDRLLLRWPCATSVKGTGSIANSDCTPLGWHTVAARFGKNAELGQVFKSRRATGEIWHEGDEVDEDLVLTRILQLTGEEPGQNKGGKVDSFTRNIYIHGTNDEQSIGTASSHGCVRMRNKDVVELFKLVKAGMKVLITEEQAK